MAKKADKVIIDTNLWISFLITKNLRVLDKRITAKAIRIVFSLELIEELLAVVNRPKFKKYFHKDDVENLIDLFDVYGDLFDVNSQISICRDKKDNFLLALAKDSEADYLLTGDKDLLDLKAFGTTKIVKVSDYLKRLK
jgi:putative PIN family toxin of toxin-antitoxin system